MKTSLRKDLALYGLCLFAGFFLYVSLRELPGEVKNFPAAILVGLIIVSAIGFLRTLTLLRSTEKTKPTFQRFSLDDRQRKLIFTLSGTLIYVLLLPITGFYATSFLFLFTLSKLLGERSNTATLSVAVVSLLVLYGVFTCFLKVPLPKGVFAMPF